MGVFHYHYTPQKNTANPKMTAHIKPAFFVTPTIKTLSYCKFSLK
ncbi:hypothetical protein HMPREF1436_01000 [Helicobacter pylori GAMchJs136i]|uniref:Uncharacterized protein n=1 Tax=Helicobacter pylori GAM100Ai TaxID=1159019 RepID=A0AB72ZT94_HELPX|nr:hypothetical protein HMPREF1391_01410 [Helicobacter pylori GAM100Ai]EMJ43540.1 hypothetical protein HMPREF1436_01000 [Helicobacter pylori GAMchJs136i]